MILSTSGISLFSSDTMTIKHKDAISVSSTSTVGNTIKVPRISQVQLSESIIGPHKQLTQQQLEEIRRYYMINTQIRCQNLNYFCQIRSKRHQQQPPLPQKNLIVPPPIPAKNLPQSAQHHQQQPPQQLSQIPTASETTTVVYSFCDEDVPYRIKIPGKSPVTLKQFKDFLPKKGNYR